jgi:Protein of unknown function (DUF3105)
VRTPWWERLAIGIVSLAMSVGLIAALSGYFAGRDSANVSGDANRIGLSFPDLGDALLRPGQPRPLYNSIPPTSGAHLDEAVQQSRATLNDDQLLTALAEGNVVVMYGSRRPPAGLTRLATTVAGPFTPALAADGGAVILARRPGTVGLIGLAWTRMVRVSGPHEPLLRQFAQVWLGHGPRH